jgi:hypothetical protein
MDARRLLDVLAMYNSIIESPFAHLTVLKPPVVPPDREPATGHDRP